MHAYARGCMNSSVRSHHFIHTCMFELAIEVSALIATLFHACKHTHTHTHRNDNTFEVGEEVESTFCDGNWYTAVIDDVRADGTVLLTWHDNDNRDRIKPLTEIRKIRVFPADLEELDDSERTSRRQQATRLDEPHGCEEEKTKTQRKGKTKFQSGRGERPTILTHTCLRRWTQMC
jgi:hypothetical protein